MIKNYQPDFVSNHVNHNHNMKKKFQEPPCDKDNFH